jgi:hypothetical protein
LTTFRKLWRSIFPHVRIREYKAVTGKCTACAILSDLRRKHKAYSIRTEIHELHALHRITYMGERSIYYDKCWKSILQPEQYMSVIMDGMSTNHTELPWLSNKNKIGDASFTQHLQGMIQHGDSFTMYRTFGNIPGDSNAAIHCLLLQLQRRVGMSKTGRLPDTVYIQIDGGSENANKYLLAICEILVSLNWCKRIFLTRLPVGHTHEDIDAKFGELWKKIRNCSVVTPQQYKEFLYHVFGKKENSLHFECIDVAFKFESCARSDAFPLGVISCYCAFYLLDIVYVFAHIYYHVFSIYRYVRLIELLPVMLCTSW